MRITLITVGKIKEKYFTDAIAEYQKRLSRYCKLEILEVADEKTPDGASAAIEEQIKEKEAERVRKVLKDSAYTIALAIDGKQMTSENFAEKIQGLGIRGESHICFLIGGSLGMSDSQLENVAVAEGDVGQSPSPGRRTHQFFENDISPPTDACDPSGTDLSRFPNHPSRTIS